MALAMSKQVLLVEDEANIRDTLRFNLTREGYNVREAKTAGEALRLVRSSKPDIILLDGMLPEMSGFEVCRIIRKDSAVPIIMLTAKDQEVDKVVGLGVGADDYITKPFGLRELFARMTAVLRRTDAQASGAVAAPPDVDRLSFLLAYPGRAHTRSYLLQQVWKYNYVGDAKTVDVHVRWLRSKFEDRSDFEIVTVRGVGYRLE